MAFVKLNRDIEFNDAFFDNDLLAFYVKLILSAKFMPCREKGIEIQRGQVVTSIRKLSDKFGFSIQHTRTILKKLEEAQLILIESYRAHSIITINDYDCDDDFSDEETQEITHEQHMEQHAGNTPSILLKERKNLIKQETRACARNSETDFDARRRLVELFGETNVAEYERRFELWRGRQDRPVRVSCYEIIERWMKTDGAQKPHEPSYDVDEIMRRMTAQYSGSA